MSEEPWTFEPSERNFGSTDESSSLIRSQSDEPIWVAQQQLDQTFHSSQPWNVRSVPVATNFFPDSVVGLWNRVSGQIYRPLSWAGYFDAGGDMQGDEMGNCISTQRNSKRPRIQEVQDSHQSFSEAHRVISNEHFEDVRRAERLQRENDELISRNIRLEKQLSNLAQGQDFQSDNGAIGPEHGKVQGQIADLGRNLRNWIRRPPKGTNYQKDRTATVDNFPFDEFPEFQNELKNIWNKSVDSRKLTLMRVSIDDLLEAVVAHMVFRDVILKPLNACVSHFRDQFNTEIYGFMVNVNKKEARRWQASCLAAYEEYTKASMYAHGIFEEAQIEFCTSVCRSIIHTIEKVATRYCGTVPAGEGLVKIVNQALVIATMLGKLQSGLELLDLHWFERNNVGFSSFDNRVTLRSASNNEDLKANSKGKIAIVLSPGLIKWGRDNGNNFENWSVWTSAKVEATDLQLVDDLSARGVSSQAALGWNRTQTTFGTSQRNLQTQLVSVRTSQQRSLDQDRVGYQSHPRMVSPTADWDESDLE